MFTTFMSRTIAATPIISHSARRRSRAKRGQVARACDWCRANRVKCDDHQPCTQCQARRVECIRRPPKFLQKAALKSRENNDPRRNEQEGDFPTHNQDSRNGVSFTDASLQGLDASGTQSTISERYERDDRSLFPKQFSAELSSSLNFRTQLNRQLKTFSNLEETDEHFELRMPDVRALSSERNGNFAVTPEITSTSPHEEMYLKMFWESYHCLYPILDEDDFRTSYRAMCTNSGSEKEGGQECSALTDIVLALCFQLFATSLDDIPSTNQPDDAMISPDSSLSGRHYYRRCQDILAESSESPSLASIQAHTFSAVYLINAGFLKTAALRLASTVRSLQALRASSSLSLRLSRIEDFLCRNLDHTLYILDFQLSLQLGLCPNTDAYEQLKGSSFKRSSSEAETLHSSSVPDHGSVSWLDYQKHLTKLFEVMESIRANFSLKCLELGLNRTGDIRHNSDSAEKLAAFLKDQFRNVRAWRDSVPLGLRLPRKDSTDPFSMNRCTLKLDLFFTPTWLQLQRVLLEITYHQMKISLLRPFYRLSPVATAPTPLSDGLNIACLNHAIAVTSILHQILCETTLSFAFQILPIQWDAMFAVMGFIVANPVSPLTSTAVAALKASTIVLEKISKNFPMAADAREKSLKLYDVILQFVDQYSLSGKPSAAVRSQSGASVQTKKGEQSQGPVDTYFTGGLGNLLNIQDDFSLNSTFADFLDIDDQWLRLTPNEEP